MEFVGKTRDGRRFMGIVKSKAIANIVECSQWQLLPIPDHWTLEDAATVYFAYGKVNVIWTYLRCLKYGLIDLMDVYDR